MNSSSHSSSRTRLTLMAVSGMVALASMILQAATNPVWWVTRGTINTNLPPNDFAAVNQGQLKWMASNACEELEATLPGGAGYNIWSLISSFSNTNNFRPVNQGQLKYVAQPFYNRLMEVGYVTNYPWTGSTNAPRDFALANIGQMKNVFSFDVEPWLQQDATGEGIPNWWKVTCGYSALTSGTNVAANGQTLAQNFQNGTNPNLFPVAPAVTTTTGQYIYVELSKCGFDEFIITSNKVYKRMDEVGVYLIDSSEPPIFNTNAYAVIHHPTPTNCVVTEEGYHPDYNVNTFTPGSSTNMTASNSDTNILDHYTQTLSDEYTTAMLTNLTTQALQIAGEDPDQWLDVAAESDIKAFRLLSEDEKTCTMQKVHFQFGFGSVTGQLYKVTWTERFISQDGATTNDTIRTDFVAGTGGSVTTTNHVLIPPVTNGTITVISLNPMITQPWGSAVCNRNPTNCWLPAANRFDFQGVTSNSPGPYTLVISGQVATTATHLWSLDSSVGTLTNTNDASPTFIPPSSITQTAGVTGVLKLQATVDGVPTPASDQKTIIIYPDHLARDFTNFYPQLGQTCKNARWNTAFGEISMSNTNGKWNCFGSVEHAYNGNGDGFINPGPPPCTTSWPKTNFTYPFCDGATNMINGMKRGDVVVYYYGTLAQHAATSVGGSLTWGANNSKMDPIGGNPPLWWQPSWKWDQSDVFNTANDYYKSGFYPIDHIELRTKIIPP